jgi:hypothetical protein
LSDTELTLAMPVALPGEGVDAATFYAALSPLIDAQVTDNVISVWTEASSDDYCGIYPMIRAAAWYVPSGSTGIDGSTPVTSNTLYCKTWLWEYKGLQDSAGGTIVPAVIAYSNLEQAKVQSDLEAELARNDRYAGWDTTKRGEAVTNFLAGNLKVLLDAGTRVGVGLEDTTDRSGYRKVNLTLLDADGNALDPSFYFSLWDTIGGDWVDNHPLIALVQGPVSPAMSPIEGTLRVKVTGTGLTADTAVTFGGVAATDGYASSDGVALYVTVPEGVAGTVDLVVDANTYPGAFVYTEEVLATAQAALVSYLIYLEELKQRANDLSAAGTLDNDAIEELEYEMQLCATRSTSAVGLRVSNSGAAAADPAVFELFDNAIDSIQALASEAWAAIGYS